MTALIPAEAIPLAVRLLEEAGFAVTARNERGDSVYCRRGTDTLTIRISNHSRTPKQRRNHPDVATSLVICTPKAPEQVAVMVAEALRIVAAQNARRSPLPAAAKD